MTIVESCNVMVVDDQPVDRQILCSHLSNYCSITQYSNGHSAIQSVKKQSPDVILLDVKMPEIDGLDVCRQLREVSSKITVIFVSGVESKQIENQCWEAGGDDFLSKPVTKFNLIDRINTLLVMKTRVRAFENEIYFHFPKYTLNKKWYLDFIDRQCDISNMRKIPLSLLIIKIQNIDKLYDLYGWQETDNTVTKILSGITKKLMNSNDLVIRYERDKLLCVLAESGSETARHFIFMLQRIITQNLHVREDNGFNYAKLDCVAITQTAGKLSADEMIVLLEKALVEENKHSVTDENRLLANTIETKDQTYAVSSYLNDLQN
jgi:CheY-like chemotaxis protein/GGDEF domain-containing protein